jgi:hypothetical protein
MCAHTAARLLDLGRGVPVFEERIRLSGFLVCGFLCVFCVSFLPLEESWQVDVVDSFFSLLSSGKQAKGETVGTEKFLIAAMQQRLFFILGRKERHRERGKAVARFELQSRTQLKGVTLLVVCAAASSLVCVAFLSPP